MRYKWLVLLFLFLFPLKGHTEELNVVIIYTDQAVEVPSDVYKLDGLISHFSNNITIIRDQDVTSDTLDGASYIFYYGVSNTTIAETARDQLNETTLPLYVIGHNAEQLAKFSNFKYKRFTGVSKFLHSRTDQTVSFSSADVVTTLMPTKEMDIHVQLIQNKDSYPVLVQIQSDFYAGINNLSNRTHLFVADSLFDFFQVQAKPGHEGYLRLEDVSPNADPKLVAAIGDYLLDRNIPFLLSVIPVYTDAESGQNVQFTDRPKLLKVIQQLEKRGASIIAHGYTHQYRSSETGEGFEFWDVENNQPVLVPANEKLPILKQREAFPNEQSYQEYHESLLEEEATYIRSKLTTSIHAFVSLGLHPLGFEAPHYAMSRSGYTVTSEYFNNVFGQVQWSNENWEVMSATPYISKPKLLDGMTLYPETIGYVRTDIPRPIDEMRQSLEEILIVRESMIGAFYHPYIGTKHLPDLIDMMEATPGFSWLNLRETDATVETTQLSIKTEGGRLVLLDDRSAALERLQALVPSSFLERALLVLAVITFIAVTAFLAYTIYLRNQRKKRLFQERA